MARIVIYLEDCEVHEEAESSALKVMNESYYKYIEKHGYHFTNLLGEYASSRMKNADESKHSWSCREVEIAVSGINYTNRNKFTIGDYTYLSNMAYADLFPKLLKTETDCVKYSCMLAEDVDGCEGMPFRRFLADLIGEGREFDFSQFC